MSMNRSQAETFRDLLLNHKYNLIHMLPSTEVPELSGFYLKNFYNGTKRYRLKLPELISEPEGKFCGNCGAVRIPSFNTRMSILESGKESEDSNEIIKTLQYTCLHCKNNTQLAPIRIPKKNIVESDQSSNSKKEEEELKQNRVTKTSSAKGRMKKRKKNMLSNMLSQKNEEKKNKTFSLSLESMMQND